MLVFFNLFCLYLVIDFFLCSEMEDLLRYNQRRFLFYMLFITLLFNLYLQCFIAIKKRFED